MPVEIKEFVIIKTIDGAEQKGQAVASNLVAVKAEDGSLFFGTVVSGDRVETTVVCDNPACTQGLVDLQMHTVPKTIKFDENGRGPEGDDAFVKEASKIITVADFNGKKFVLCSAECAGSFLKRVSKIV